MSRARVDNPWAALPETAPFVLESDRPYVEAWNATVRGEGRLKNEM